MLREEREKEEERKLSHNIHPQSSEPVYLNVATVMCIWVRLHSEPQSLTWQRTPVWTPWSGNSQGARWHNCIQVQAFATRSHEVFAFCLFYLSVSPILFSSVLHLCRERGRTGFFWPVNPVPPAVRAGTERQNCQEPRGRNPVMEVTCSRSLKDRFCLLAPTQGFSTKTTRTSPRIAQETNILHGGSMVPAAHVERDNRCLMNQWVTIW